MLNLAKHVQAHAAADPRRLALFGEGQSLDYGELARRAANLASALTESETFASRRSQRPCVGVIASRSVDACVAVLGCAWAGATYVPIGTKTPEDRLHRLMSLCELSALVADASGSRLLSAALKAPGASDTVIAPKPERLRDLAAKPGLRLLDLSALPDVPAPPLYAFEPSDLAYIMFTSGTTGVPKGVMISQAAVGAFIEMIGERLRLAPDDRTLEVTELGFDVSVLNMFATWQAKASLHVLPSVRVMNAVAFAREQRLSVWSSTPSLIALLRQIKALAPNALPDLRLAIFIGEPLSKATVVAVREAAPSCVIEDLYGPTETTVINTGQRIELGDAYVVTPKRDVMSIGTALPGNRAEVFDARGRVANAGEIGELALAGVQLAEGYLGAPELTAKKFPVIDGTRWYFTGDSAFRDEEGNLHHLGRIDNQVKILGNRVELEEIEAHVRELTGLSLVAALPWPTREGVHHGLVVCLAGENRVADADILTGLATRVPAYMLPSRLVWVDAMPTNSNGKIDRRALLETLGGPPPEKP
ncbi:MAG TPA: AMP-binding protein [Polyangiales bacterium]|nr:AMP-binding protein [Polyangiales bacterium]